jgi:cystathionine gamma-synthase
MMSATATVISHQSELGGSVPPRTPRAISVSLQTWKDDVGYAEGEERIVT